MWDNNTFGVYRETKDSFIFSLKNGNIQKSILSRVKEPKKALYYYKKIFQNYCGPYFGHFYMYSDQSNFTLDCESGSFDYGIYEKPIRTSGNFSIIDYEVFKVNRKTK
ncbi:hypothetical protein Glove_306g68 [Diversispora epigaea]|uniref:TLDc domain-containing protein n=1 Tax=Diversispora epigaea TaxID=1348612 RepID=A0A397I1C6_9GLOM|nr:hypothetical protein Glove_306g68 [Diversispora epigaea]